MATSRPWLKADPAGRSAGTLAQYRAGRDDSEDVPRAERLAGERSNREKSNIGTGFETFVKDTAKNVGSGLKQASETKISTPKVETSKLPLPGNVDFGEGPTWLWDLIGQIGKEIRETKTSVPAPTKALVEGVGSAAKNLWEANPGNVNTRIADEVYLATGADVGGLLGEDIKVDDPFEKKVIKSSGTSGLSNVGRLQSKPMSEQDFAAQPIERQQALVANDALYKAGLADKQAGTTENSDRLIQEFGLQGVTAQDIISGRAIATENDLDGNKLNNRAGSERRLAVLDQLGKSAVFQSESLKASLANGEALLDALRNTQTLSPETQALTGSTAVASQLDDASKAELDNLLEGLVSRNVWQRIQVEPELNQKLQQDIATASAKYGTDVMTKYFDETYKGFAGDDGFMSYDEFIQNWLEKK